MPRTIDNVETWKRRLLWVMRIAILIAGVEQVLFGEKFFGLLALLALAIVTLPCYFTQHRICMIPVEIEILLLIVVFFEFIVADAHSFYSRVPFYDKFMHYMVSAILGIIGMLFIYTAYAYGHLKASLPVMFALIVFIVMGFGALLEMVEFFYDQVLYQFIGSYLPTGLTQGSLISPPYQDTMYDLYLDTVGGIFGAAVGAWIIRKSEKTGDKHLIDEIAELEGFKK